MGCAIAPALVIGEVRAFGAGSVDPTEGDEMLGNFGMGTGVVDILNGGVALAPGTGVGEVDASRLGEDCEATLESSLPGDAAWLAG